MPLYDRSAPRRVSAAPREGDNSPYEEPAAPVPQGNLAKGIVWADVLADIAADEEERRRRDLPDAA